MKVRTAIDECALRSFAFLGEPFDLDRELLEETPTEAYHDKLPRFFPGLPVAAKLEIGKAMARMRLPVESQYRLSYSSGGSVQVQFSQVEGVWTAPIRLKKARHLPNAATVFAPSS